MLADMHTPLEPPSAPFASRADSFRSLSPKNDLSPTDKHLSTSLSINYLPSKFSNTIVTKRRRNGKGADYMMPKQGGGREAFKSNEARMPGEGEDDYDGVDVGLFGGKEGGRSRPKGHWNRFKWCLFVANSIVRALSSVSRPLFVASGAVSMPGAGAQRPSFPSAASAPLRPTTGERLLTAGSFFPVVHRILDDRPRRLFAHLVQRLDAR